MRFITSISPNRLERQIKCINSWTPYCSEIVAVQTADEVSLVKNTFDFVRVVTTDQGSDIFDSPHCPRIYELIKQGPGLIINSDIEIHTSHSIFSDKFLTYRDNVLECGIRYDNNKLNKYGIDAFKITDQLMEIYQDTPFGIGQPGWDYYLIKEAARQGIYINAHKKPAIFYHEVHELNWPRWKLSMAQSLLEKQYDSCARDITLEIQRLTGRR